MFNARSSFDEIRLFLSFLAKNFGHWLASNFSLIYIGVLKNEIVRGSTKSEDSFANLLIKYEISVDRCRSYSKEHVIRNTSLRINYRYEIEMRSLRRSLVFEKLLTSQYAVRRGSNYVCIWAAHAMRKFCFPVLRMDDNFVRFDTYLVRFSKMNSHKIDSFISALDGGFVFLEITEIYLPLQTQL